MLTPFVDTVGFPIKRRTVYFNESGSDLIITQDMVPKDDTLHLIGLGDVSFNSITINAERVNVTNLKANDFVWTKASKESSCKDCGTIRLRASGRFFKCSATPTFENVIATVMAPSCKIRFVESQVTILRDKSSPKPDYINTTITDFTDLIEIFGPKYETEYFTGFAEFYDEEWTMTAQTLGIFLGIEIVALFVLHPEMRSLLTGK